MDVQDGHSARRGWIPLMTPILGFFAVATAIGCIIGATVRLRLRAAARQPDVSEDQLCELRQANRISSVAVIVSLSGLALAALAYVVL